MERAGTGGALFRNLYRDFLTECAQLIDSSRLRTGHTLYAEAATLWTQVAALVAAAGESGDARSLVQAGSLLHDLSRIEREAVQALSLLQALSGRSCAKSEADAATIRPAGPWGCGRGSPGSTATRRPAAP